jgi:hypothetical protein
MRQVESLFSLQIAMRDAELKFPVLMYLENRAWPPRMEPETRTYLESPVGDQIQRHGVTIRDMDHAARMFSNLNQFCILSGLARDAGVVALVDVEGDGELFPGEKAQAEKARAEQAESERLAAADLAAKPQDDAPVGGDALPVAPVPVVDPAPAVTPAPKPATEPKPRARTGPKAQA